MKLLTIILVVLSLLGIGAHAQTDTDAVKVNLGTADKFALLGGSGITNVSAHTFIIGDVGSSPTTHCDGNQAVASEGTLVPQVQPRDGCGSGSLTTAYNQAAGATCRTNLTGKNLGGKKLIPGVYCFDSGAIDRHSEAKRAGESQCAVDLSDRHNSGDRPKFQGSREPRRQGRKRMQCVLAGRFLSDGRER